MTEFLSLPRKYWYVLVGYTAVVLYTVAHHEPWFDEAQSWLLARDLSLPRLWFHYLRYEGTPGLWQTVLWFINLLHVQYSALGWIGAGFAIAGMFVFLKYAPFPDIIKVLLPFSFFFLYQYAVVARSYVLLPLCAFLTAHFYRSAKKNTYAFVAALSLLANVSAQGCMIAVGLGMAYAISVLRTWKTMDAAERRRHFIAAGIFAVVMVLEAIMVFPPKDESFIELDLPRPAYWVALIMKIVLSGALVDAWVPSLIIVVAFLLWTASRRSLAPMALPIALLLIFFIRVYVNLWHHGSLFVAMLMGLWVAWPSEEERMNWQPAARMACWSITGVLTGVLCLHLYWASNTINYDVRFPYSGSTDAARYLKSVRADSGTVYGFGFSSAALNAYFPKNIYANQARPDGSAFWLWDKSNKVDLEWNKILQGGPDYLVYGYKRFDDGRAKPFNKLVTDGGYSLVHVSNGAIYWKNGLMEPDSYLIYRRNDQITSASK